MNQGQPDDLNLLREWREPIPPARLITAMIGVIIYHAAALFLVVVAVSAPPSRQVPEFAADLRKSVPLYLPEDLRQKDPNRGKMQQPQLDVRSLPPPAPVPQAPRVRQAEPSPALPAPAPLPAIEAPAIEAAAAPPPPPSGRIVPPAPLPPLPAEKPKLAFESVGAAGSGPRIVPETNIRLPQLSTNITETARASSQPTVSTPSNRGVVIGDLDETVTAPGSTNAPSSGPVRSNLQLLSDPNGVDFKPYLIQVLTAVRTNWLSVIPESARLGRRGKVMVQFIIDRRGRMPKIVIAEESGTLAFDRAAIAGVNASVPFPPLPPSYKGTEIRLQLAFTYNQAPR